MSSEIPILYDNSQNCLIYWSSANSTLRFETAPSNIPESTPTINCPRLTQNDVYVIESARAGVGNGPGTGARESETGASSTGTSIYSLLINPLFQWLGIAHQLIVTDSPHSIIDFARNLQYQGREITVVMISGDTSVNELINGIGSTEADANLNISVIPAGTGNSLALSLGVKSAVDAVQRLLAKPETRPFHLYQVRFPPGSYFLRHDGSTLAVGDSLLFIVVASWAFHASLVADSDGDDFRKLGIDRFRIAAEANCAREQSYKGKAEIVYNGGEVSIESTNCREVSVTRAGPFAYFVLTPSQRFEPKFLVLPEGNIFDLNLYLVGFNTQTEDNYIMSIMGEIYDGGRHILNERVFYDKVKPDKKVVLSVGLNVKDDRRFCVDGAIVVVEENTEVSFGYYGTNVNGWNLKIVS